MSIINCILKNNEKSMRDDKLAQFKSLSYEEKLKIDTNILSVLGEKWNKEATEILDTINNMDSIPDNVLNSIYLDFENSIDKIRKGKIEDKLHSFVKARKYINSLREQEKLERESENTEDLLKGI